MRLYLYDNLYRNVFRRYSQRIFDKEKILYNSQKETIGRGKKFIISQIEKRKNNVVLETQSPNIPVALSFLYSGATALQGPIKNTDLVEDFESDEKLNISPLVYPLNEFFKGEKEKRKSSQIPDFEVIRKDKNEEEIFRFGSANPNFERNSKITCGGCGSLLHCKDIKLPGFIPCELFETLTDDQLRSTFCQRCYFIEHYNIALKLNVSPTHYPDTIKHIKREKNAIICLVVDLLDFPGSVWPNIVDIIGTDKRIILVGNKVDLIPQDSHSYLQNIQKTLFQGFESKSYSMKKEKLSFLSSILVSARTGYNIESLINLIYSTWSKGNQKGGNIYLIGTTNVGKSSLFNALLMSDLCKAKAIDLVSKAVTSPVPGTTLNLLKFPIMRPDPKRLFLRRDRLKNSTHELCKIQEIHRLELLRKTKDRKYTVRNGVVEKTFYQEDKNIEAFVTFGMVNTELRRSLPERLNPLDPSYADGHWCHDTPGTISEDQILNILTQEEIVKVVPNTPIQPRSFVLRVGMTVFMGGIGRFDVLSSEVKTNYPLLLTVFCSNDLPLFVVESENAENFFECKELLGVPINNSDRLKNFPSLEYKTFTAEFGVTNRSTMDIVLSSAGWISLAPRKEQKFKIRVWTPHKKGIVMRRPSMLPFAHQLRGDRIKGTPSYKNDKIYFPDGTIQTVT